MPLRSIVPFRIEKCEPPFSIFSTYTTTCWMQPGKPICASQSRTIVLQQRNAALIQQKRQATNLIQSHTHSTLSHPSFIYYTTTSYPAITCRHRNHENHQARTMRHRTMLISQRLYAGSTGPHDGLPVACVLDKACDLVILTAGCRIVIYIIGKNECEE